MVPSIYPLETLHNSLSLKKVTEFLSLVCENAGDTHSHTGRALSAMFSSTQPQVETYLPQRVLPSALRSRTDRPPWYSSGPSSTVSSAGPSSPNADSSPRFSFSEKLTPQSSEETQPANTNPVLPANDPQCTAATTEVPLTPNNSPQEEDVERTEAQEEEARPPSALADLPLSRMEPFSLPGSLPVLLELRESSSEAGSSSQTPQSPEDADEFFDTSENVWSDAIDQTEHAQNEEETEGKSSSAENLDVGL